MKPASVHAASMAVLVVGMETDAAGDAFAAGIKYEFTQKGYTVVDNTAVQTKLAELRTAYKNGNTVDTVGLAAWGETNSIDFVQLVVEKGKDLTVSGREQLGQVVTCGATKYAGRAYYRTRFVPQETMPCERDECEKLIEMVVGKMVYVAGGVFEMGCKPGRDDINDACVSTALPLHYVRVNSFYIGPYEVTQELWKKVMGTNPSKPVGDSLPVNNVTWEAIAGVGGFLETLNAMTGRNFRLPTEAEWEYAARGCNAGVCESYEYSGSDTIDNVGWYGSNSNGNPHVGGKKPANGLGLYDMTGNQWEWCNDWYSATYYPSGTTASNPQDNPKGPNTGTLRSTRGGSFVSLATTCRVGNRSNFAPNYCELKHGFRLVLP
jgi:formylglycine-generating enzyme required for sulfatase activity